MSLQHRNRKSMRKKFFSTSHAVLAIIAVGCCGLSAELALATPVNHGDFDDIAGGGSTFYLDVTETANSVPAPPGGFLEPEAIVDKLDFDPAGFAAQSLGGTPDLTDVQLNFTVETVDGAGITSLLFTEGGDFSLFGGTDLTKVIARMIVDVDILQVDGIDLLDPIQVQASATFSVDATMSIPSDPFWSNAVLIEFGAVLSGEGISYDLGVTKAEVVVDDQLIAFSESGAISFIAKKDFMVGPGIELDPNALPEPSTLVMLCIGMIGTSRVRFA